MFCKTDTMILISSKDKHEIYGLDYNHNLNMIVSSSDDK